MKTHANARLSLKGRELLIARVQDAGWSLSSAAEAAGISDRTARQWLARYRAGGRDGLLDRSSAPSLVANRTEDQRVQVIAALRRLRMTGLRLSSASILVAVGQPRREKIGAPAAPGTTPAPTAATGDSPGAWAASSLLTCAMC